MAVGRYKLNYDDLVVWDLGVDQPKLSALKHVFSAGLDMRDSVISSNVVSGEALGGPEKIYHIAAENEYPALVLTVPYDSLDNKKVRWMRCSGRFLLPEPVWGNIYDNTLLIM